MEKTAEIYIFQENLPNFLIINVAKDFNESPVRPAIMKILSEGISDDQSQNHDRTRFALTAKEIKEKLENSDNPKVNKTSYTNLYFHLNKMVEAGTIQLVAKVIERSHRIKYYGRSAHVILIGNPETETQNLTKTFHELFKLLNILNPDFPDIQVEKIAEQYVQQKRDRDTNFGEWIAKNISIIRKNSLDVGKIFKALQYSDVQNSRFDKVFNEIIPFISD
jgi:hypothetical protein